MIETKNMSVLFVCTGNICRSPTAEAVLRELGRKEGVPLQVESRGTHDYHVGQPPDERAQHHARRRGYDLGALRARKLTGRDFQEFDLILAMDQIELLEVAPRSEEHTSELQSRSDLVCRLLLEKK